MNYDSPSQSSPLMDSHKIAAAFFCSFLKAKPIKYSSDGSGNPPTGLELHVNKYGAFVYGLQVLNDFWTDKTVDSVTAEEQEIHKQPIRFPETGKDNYPTWFIKLVDGGVEKYLDHEDEKYEEKLMFFIAHIYFMLESYNYQFHKANLYESRSNKLASDLLAAKNTQ